MTATQLIAKLLKQIIDTSEIDLQTDTPRLWQVSASDYGPGEYGAFLVNASTYDEVIVEVATRVQSELGEIAGPIAEKLDAYGFNKTNNWFIVDIGIPHRDTEQGVLLVSAPESI